MISRPSLSACALALGLFVPVSGTLSGTPAGTLPGSGFRVLYTFTGGNDGANPLGNAMRLSGVLYGTTYFGGAYGHGTVFKVSAGTETVLYSFTGAADGSQPYATLVTDKSGSLYGTTYYGGMSGRGTVFRVDADGTETVLHSFTGGADGGNPEFGLAIDRKGNLYGEAGANIFRIRPDGAEKVLYRFGGSDNPNGDLLLDASGNIYGTTHNGGANSAGSVWKLAPGGTLTTLYSFKGAPDAGYPFGGLIMDPSGNLYGTSWGGGVTGGSCAKYGCGTVFSVSAGGQETVLYSFTAGNDGAHPQYGRLARDDAGNLYGMTVQGGAGNYGTVFKIAPGGSETVLHTFSTGSDGLWPNASVISDKKGHLYGLTQFGGTGGQGTVFRMNE